VKPNEFDPSSLEAEMMCERIDGNTRRGRPASPMRDGSWRAVLLVAVFGLLLGPSVSHAQLDICGCEAAPSLGTFDTSDPTTYPPGTTVVSGFNIIIPLPEDGILIFDAFSVTTNEFGGAVSVQFEPNAANTPVTVLVKGDATIGGSSSMTLGGQAGTPGSFGAAGVGGLGGPGGFRGGDAAFELVNLANDGGAGFGPGGGAAGTASPLAFGGDGVVVGAVDLLPLVGGSGGGGGASADPDAACAGGGGGGGGGAILLAANGTITINSGLYAQGGVGGFVPFSSTCASRGGDGAGGSIRLLADTIGGSGFIFAGAIRMEALNDAFPANNTTPAASRVPVPGPLTDPLMPSIAFTEVNGETVSVANGALLSESPQGVFGVVDVVLPAPGVATFNLATSGVPTGTTVEVTAKSRLGGGVVVTSTTLAPGSCNGAGDCASAVAFDLQAGAYVVEARATFEVP